MEPDVGDEAGGEQSAWLDLVARLELPSHAHPAAVPWPDRENLPVPTDRSRVIRPASGERAADDNHPADGSHPDPAAGARPAELGTEPTDTGAADSAYTDPAPWRPSARNLSAEDYLDLVDIGYVDYDIGDQDDRYIPPPLPPQPRLDPVARGAWAALLGGPGYLLAATLLGWQIPGWAQLAAVIAFMAGFVVLVFRLGDGPSKRDGPDQGAVV